MKSIVLSLLAAGSLPAQEKPLTSVEENLLKVAVSEADYHYLGSGIIMAAIGNGFADSMLNFRRK